MFQKPGVGTDPKITTGSATLVFTYRQILFSFFVAVIRIRPDPVKSFGSGSYQKMSQMKNKSKKLNR